MFLAFPEHARRLRLLLDVEADFVELCEDFDAVSAAYERQTANDSPSRDTATEYHGLRIELEAEILAWLEQGSQPGGER